MATGQGILDKLKQARVEAEYVPPAGVLPLVAFYGRGEEEDEQRTRMYDMVRRVMRMRDHELLPNHRAHYMFLFLEDALAVLNANASPIEFLVSRGELESAGDEDGMGGVRFHTALRLRDLISGAQVKPLKAQSFGDAVSGGAGAADIRGYQLDCMKLLGRVRKDMPEAWIYPMVEAIVFMDEWFDLWPEEDLREERRKLLRRQRQKTVNALHYALDRAGATLGYISDQEFTQRWNHGSPDVPTSVRRRNRASKAANQLALLTSQGARKA
jgi:hypothetical protein